MYKFGLIGYPLSHSMSKIIQEAAFKSIGEEGTIMMPTQSWKNLDPSTGVHWEEPEEWWELIRDNWPAYDKDIKVYAITGGGTIDGVANLKNKTYKTEDQKKK